MQSITIDYILMAPCLLRPRIFTMFFFKQQILRAFLMTTLFTLWANDLSYLQQMSGYELKPVCGNFHVLAQCSIRQGERIFPIC